MRSRPMKMKTAAELGLTEEQLRSQVAFADEALAEMFAEENVVEVLELLFKWWFRGTACGCVPDSLRYQPCAACHRRFKTDGSYTRAATAHAAKWKGAGEP